MYKRIRIMIFIVLSILCVVGSGCTTKPANLTDDQVAAVAENILRSLDDNDYQAFIHDFGDAMLAVIDEAEFTEMRDMLQNASGNFVSLGESMLINSRGYAVYRFPCQFEQEEVLVTITFEVGGETVEGLFFDSPHLREANE